MKDKLGAYPISETITDEILITAYDYNSQEPRFFSKIYAELDPKLYDIPVGNATGASSAAPTFFDPKKQINGYNLLELQIDGGIICNNPALYAYQIATVFRKQSNVRILSLGTGENPFTKLKSKFDFDKRAYVKWKNEFMMNMDNYAAEYYLRAQFANLDKSDDYLRIQKVTSIPMDDISKKNIDLLKSTSDEMYNTDKESINKMIESIVDEKFAPEPAPKTE